VIGMVEISAAYIIENEANPVFKASLESILSIADEVIIIDGGSTDGTLELIDSFHSKKIKVIYKKFLHDSLGADGIQRNEYLKYVTKDWVLVIDADEVLGDNGFMLKKIAEENSFDAYDLRMVHFVDNLAFVDATKEEHLVTRRFFKNKPGLKYPEKEHAILEGYSNPGVITDVTLFHYGFTFGVWKNLKKYRMNLKKSNYSPEWLRDWIDSRLLGKYPSKPFEGEHPMPIKELIR